MMMLCPLNTLLHNPFKKIMGNDALMIVSHQILSVIPINGVLVRPYAFPSAAEKRIAAVLFASKNPFESGRPPMVVARGRLDAQRCQPPNHLRIRHMIEIPIIDSSHDIGFFGNDMKLVIDDFITINTESRVPAFTHFFGESPPKICGDLQ